MAQGEKRIPAATYRLQFNAQFTFDQAAEIAPYLRELGVTDCYASPFFRSTPGSTHGYDVCDFGVLNPELGGPEAFARLTGARRACCLGLVVDMVPNHMGNHLSNPFWFDVLKNGPKSKYAAWFDINWEPPRPDMRARVLLPILGDRYDKVLHAGGLKVLPGPAPAEFSLAYYDRRFPLCSESIDWLRDKVARTGLEELNGRPGEPGSFAALHQLIQQQHYRLAYWRVGSESINYRRFFEVTELASLRMECAEVFTTTHKLLLELLRQGSVTGLRIDHPDGLWDPREYFVRLKETAGVYVVVEKILAGGEPLPQDWPVEGTTGYDFLNRVNGLFVDARNCRKMDAIYREFTGLHLPFERIAYEGKKQILEKSLISEVKALTRRLAVIASKTRIGQDLTHTELRGALLEIIAAFPVYRTYITESTQAPSLYEKRVIEEAVRAAKSHSDAAGSANTAALEFLRTILLLQRPPDLSNADWQQCRTFVMRFQQLSAPTMAKGLEDTAFYIFHRLVSLNEVGGDPEKFGISPAEFHQANLLQLRNWPHTLLATSTHDTKRGEDVRARINVLSEMPDLWASAVKRWSKLNGRHKTPIQGRPAPDANDEYLFYQVLTGTWQAEAQDPPSAQGALTGRLTAYMLKAQKESKRHTTWTEPHEPYEQATCAFVKGVLTRAPEFLSDFVAFQQNVSFFGRLNSLAQTVLKLTSPGVPDIYQGTELWDFSLVDPDNRRPVDYQLRKRLLAELQRASDSVQLLEQLLSNPGDGRIKLYVIWRALEVRRRQAKLFEQADYIPIETSGEAKEHICAFARTHQHSSIIVVVPRLVYGLLRGTQRQPAGSDVWRDTKITLPNGIHLTRFRNVFTGATLAPADGHLLAADVFSVCPVALLVSA